MFFDIMHNSVETQYKSLTDNMVLEYSVYENVARLVDVNLQLLQDITNQNLTSQYQTINSGIDVTFLHLDNTITYIDSKPVYDKLKNTVKQLISESEQSITNTKNRDFTKSNDLYASLIRDEGYVKDNTAELLMQELKYATQLQKQLEITRQFTFTLGLALIVLITLSCLLLAYFLSGYISKPLANLSNLAKNISKDISDIKMDDELLKRQDEIGSLSISFNEMLKQLHKEIESQKSTNNSLKKSEAQLRKGEDELTLRDKQLTEANETLKKVNAQLQALDSQKDEFISLAAHELKTPLTSIRGFAQILLEKNLWGDDDNKHYVELINKNTDELYTLVTDIVDSSRLGLGKLALNIEDVDVYNIFNDIKESMTVIIREKNLTPKFSIDNNLPKIRADTARTMQVLRNLISNSAKFTLEGYISLRVHLDKGFVCFEVKDTGQGIPKENMNMLFSKFYQVDSSLTRKTGGSGLGLSICKGLVERMGGKIWFESESGKGSTFYFTLPVANGGK
jgi:signal transduction histidine kinase